jgi:hypothetical protein
MKLWTREVKEAFPLMTQDECMALIGYYGQDDLCSMGRVVRDHLERTSSEFEKRQLPRRAEG